jgi:hypothetical protein
MTTTTIDSRAERLRHLRELPPALCRICGGHVRTGEGTRLPAQLGDDERMYAEWQAVLARERLGALSLPLRRYRAAVDDWRRAHDECVPEHVAVLQRVLGRRFPTDLTPRQAAEIAAEAGVALTASRAQYRGGRAFAWIGRADRRALLEAVALVQSAETPRLCADGRCGMCGRSRSLSWAQSPLRWPDGSPAPLCAECWSAWDRHPDRGERIEDLRVIGAQQLSGVSAFEMTPFGLLLACEAPAVDRHAEAAAWAYSDRLSAIREGIRTQWPGGLTDPAERDRYRELKRERDREQARERAAAERAQAEAEHADVLAGWGS